jgi:D-alanyl-D-alanine carboxypeptidase/D-alanyl-D-alanine-endopeptidase (penicillin-binding protein 4)
MSRGRIVSILPWSKTEIRACLALLMLFALPACHAGRPRGVPAPIAVNGPFQLQHDIDAVLAAPELARSTWGILVRSAKYNDTLYSRNAGNLLMPGSTMKIVTLAAAADRLHWDHVYDTRLLALGAVDSATGILNGDLLVAGTGDPSIVDAEGTASRLFAEWTQALKARGIRTITGRVIGDDNAFDDESLGPGWAWDDLPGGDATAVSGLQFNENVVLATIAPGAAIGTAAAITLSPEGSNLVLEDRLITSAAGTEPVISARRSAGSNRLELRGSIPIDAGPFVRTVSVDNPTLFFATAFRAALIASGIEVRGPAVDIDGLDSRPPGIPDTLSVHHSSPLSTLSMRLMKDSQNLYAETLIKTIGGTSGAPSFENGRLTVASILAPWGVDQDAIVQVDG